MIPVVGILSFMMMMSLLVLKRKKKKQVFLQLMSEYSLPSDEIIIQKENSSSSKAGVLLLPALSAFIFFLYPSPGIALLLFGFCSIVFSTKTSTKNESDSEIYRTLPLFLEQLSMALKSGYDLQAAMRVVIELRVHHDDPCARMFLRVQRAIEKGASFDEALSLIEGESSNGAIQYFCRYLRHSYQHGGNLSESLQELSESVQQRYEDDQETWIATLPVKATMPLLLLFLGLLLLFLTPPLLQVLSLLENVS